MSIPSGTKSSATHKDEVRGRWFADFVAPEFQATFRDRFTELPSRGEVLNVELSMVRKDRRPVRVLFNGTVERDPSGGINRIHSFLHDVSEVLSPQQVVEQGEERFRELFDHMGSCIAVYQARSAGEDFVFVDFNKAAERADAIRREDVVGKSVLTVFPGVKESGLFDVFQRVWRTGNPEHHPVAEYRDERIRGWKENYVYKLPSGEVVAIYDDVTARKEAEEGVRESEEKYRTLFDSSPVALWEEDFSAVKAYIDQLRQSGIKDVRAYFDDHPEAVARCVEQVKILEVNETTLKLYKAESKEAFLGRIGRVFGEESYATFKEELFAIADGKIRVDFDVTDQTLGGERIRVSVMWLVAPGHEESLSRVLVASVDITERMRAEEALRDSESKYRQVVENANEAIFTAQDGYMRFANPATARLLERTAEELVSRPFSDFIHPEDRAMVVKRHQRRLAGEQVETGYEFRFVTGKDGVRWGRLNTTRVEWQGRPATLNLVSDVTERREAEDRAKRAQDATILSLGSIAEMRDPYTSGHQERVTALACAIASEMGLARDRADGLRVAALLHDIGKMSVPAEILSKPGKLTGVEFSLVQEHPQTAHEIVKGIEFPWPIAEIILQHHERLDGSGYPRGLKGEAISQEAKILAVADVVEAMASHRPYRPALGVDKALEEVEREAGVLYDPEVVKACLALFQEGYALSRTLPEARQG